jgi:hypothetical protein
MDTETYNEKVTQIKERYEARILAHLERMRKALEHTGYKVGPTSEHSDLEYAWWFLVYMPREEGEDGEETREDDVDIEFVISESLQNTNETEGITFTLNITAAGGAILGGFSPYRYTSEIWVPVDDDEEIEDRFLLHEEYIDLDGLVRIINEWKDQ